MAHGKPWQNFSNARVCKNPEEISLFLTQDSIIIIISCRLLEQKVDMQQCKYKPRKSSVPKTNLISSASK